jgi:hypothetical protein
MCKQNVSNWARADIPLFANRLLCKQDSIQKIITVEQCNVTLIFQQEFWYMQSSSVALPMSLIMRIK